MQQIVLEDLLNLLAIYEECPKWLPLPEGIPNPINLTHKEYQEGYSKGVQVALSRTVIINALSHQQEGLGQRLAREYQKWNGVGMGIPPRLIPHQEVDPYSLKVLALHKRHC
jgi:hypothetical protein